MNKIPLLTGCKRVACLQNLVSASRADAANRKETVKRRASSSEPNGLDGDRPSGGRERERVRGLEAERQSLAALLNLVRTTPEQTRLDLERLSSMGRAVVTDRLATLSRLELIDESAVGRSVGGRAPRLVRFRANAGRVLVGNIDRYTLGVGLADLAGQLVFEHYEVTDLATGAAAILKRLDTLFAWALEQEPGADLWGGALGVPHAVEVRADPARLRVHARP